MVQSGGGIVRDAPAGAVAPLQDELDNVDRDLQHAGEFLLASLP
jgi:hypothetical protein